MKPLNKFRLITHANFFTLIKEGRRDNPSNEAIKEFDSFENYDQIADICDNENLLDEACVEKFYKKNILNLNYEELVKACNCSNQDCGGKKLTAGFGGKLSH